MNYLDAKTALTTRTPKVPFKLIVIEAAALIAIASLLVQFFT